MVINMRYLILLFFILLTGCAKVEYNNIDPGLYCNRETGAGIIVSKNSMDLRTGVYIDEGACPIGNAS